MLHMGLLAPSWPKCNWFLYSYDPGRMKDQASHMPELYFSQCLEEAWRPMYSLEVYEQL